MTRMRFNRRKSHDGWALRVRGALFVLPWSFSTTRAEARAELKLARQEGLLRGLPVDIEPVVVQLVEAPLPKGTRARQLLKRQRSLQVSP